MTHPVLSRLLHRVLPATAAGLLLTVLIAFLGALIGPTWQPRAYESVQPPTPDTSVAVEPSVPSVGSGGWQVEDVEIDLTDEVTVTARVRTPLDAGEDLSAVVFLHGAGTADHTGFAEQAEALASAGIVTIVPDKRMDTYTTASRDYVASAADYHRTVAYAWSLPGVESVGIYGESEGAYIAPIVATEYRDVDFVVLVSAPVVPPRQQAAYAVHTYLEATGVPDPIFRLIPRALGAEVPLGLVDYIDFDPQPYQQRLTQPLLVVYGTGDNSMPQAQGAAQIIGDAAVSGNFAVTVRYYEGTDHGIRSGRGEDPVSAEFERDLAQWIGGLPGTAEAEPRVAGALPNQYIWAEQPPRPPALLSGNLLVVSHLLPPLILVIGLVLGAVAVVRAVVLRRRARTAGARRATDAAAEAGATGEAGGVVDANGAVSGGATEVGCAVDGAGGHGAWLSFYLGAAAVLALATWYVWINYVADIAALATSYQQDPAVSFGGYNAENQIASASSFVLGVALYLWWRDARRGRRYGLLGRVAAAATAVGTAGLLILASYWSGFPTFGWGS